jgi:hypothetical protein
MRYRHSCVHHATHVSFISQLRVVVALAAVLAQYDAATTRDAQMALLDQVITLWAKGSGYWDAANDGCWVLAA